MEGGLEIIVSLFRVVAYECTVHEFPQMRMVETKCFVLASFFVLYSKLFVTVLWK